MNNDFFVLPPTQEQFMPPIFKAGKIMTPAAMIWRSLLYDLLFSVWEIGLPKGWHLSPFRWALFGPGSLGIGYHGRLGWIYGTFAVEKIDWQYCPVLFSVTPPGLTEGTDPAKVVRGLNGTVLHVHDDYTGYELMIDQYAERLAACDKCTEINLKKARQGKLIGSPSKKDADSIKAALAKTEDGEAVAYVSDKLLGEDGRLKVASLMDLASDFIGNEIMEMRLMILKEYLTRIGVRTVGLEKREHLLNQEIAENNDETGAEPYAVMSSLEEDLGILRSMGCEITIKPRYDYSGAGIGEGGNDNAKQDVRANAE